MDLSYSDGGGVKWHSHFGSLEVSYKVKHILLIFHFEVLTAILVLGIYPQEMKIFDYTKMYTMPFIVAVAITVNRMYKTNTMPINKGLDEQCDGL